ncbi:MAG: hypothetical protein ABSG96_20970 [Terracidiphilus sp.]|jgi:hypothetical protein
MNSGRSRIFSAMAACAIAAAATAPESARANSIPTKSDVVWIGVAVGAIGAGIGIGIYYAVHHNSSLTGCAASGANGLELMNKGDQQTYALVGAVAAIKPGDRIRVSGKRVKKPSGPSPQFLVEHISKDYGACPANTAAP